MDTTDPLGPLNLLVYQVLDNLVLGATVCGKAPIELTPAQRAEVLQPYEALLDVAGIQIAELLRQAKLQGAMGVHAEMAELDPGSATDQFSTEDK